MILDREITLYPPAFSDHNGNTIKPDPIITKDLHTTFHINTTLKTVHATIQNIPNSIIMVGPDRFDEIVMLTPLALENTLRSIMGENVQKYLQNLFPKTLESEPNGPGSILSGMISALGIRANPNCSCKKHALKMNEEGPDWCEQNIDTIVGWLKEESEKRKIPFVETIARLMIKRAISKSRRLLSKKK
jgi:hypothetical protein